MSTININLQGVFAPLQPRQDSYSLAYPFSQLINFYAGDDSYLQITTTDSNCEPYDTSDGALLFTIRDPFTDNAILSREAVVIDAYNAYFIISSTDFDDSYVGSYNYDVVYVDGYDTNHLIPVSQFNILKSVYVSGTPVSVPLAQQPLAQGPSGSPYLFADWIRYVDPNGNDGYSGLTPETAWATIDFALSSSPNIWGQKARIMLADGTYEMPNVQTTYSLGLPSGPGAEPLALIGNALSLLGDQAVLSASSNTITVPSAGVSDGYLIGSIAHNKTNNNRCMVVGSNHTSGLITLNTDSFFSATDIVAFERPAATINLNAPLFFVGPSIALTFAPIYCKFVMLAGSFMVIDSTSAMYKCCEMDLQGSGFHVTADGSQVTTYTLRNFFIDIIKQNQSESSIYVHDDGGSGIGWYVDDAKFIGNYVLQNAGNTFDLHSEGVLFAPFIINGSMSFTDNSTIQFQASQTTFTTPGSITNGSINISGRSTVINSGSMNVSNSGGNGINISQDAMAILSGFTGSSNAGYGVAMTADNSSIINNGSNTITGNSGDIQAGNLNLSWSTVGSSIIASPNVDSYFGHIFPNTSGTGGVGNSSNIWASGYITGLHTNGIDSIGNNTIFIGSTNSTATSLGSANTVTYLTGTGQNTGTGNARCFNPLYVIGSPATSGAQLVNSPFYYMQSNYWNGSASSTLYGSIRTVADTTAPTGHMAFGFGLASTTAVAHLDSYGNFTVLPTAGIDTMTAGSMFVGKTNATSITVGKTGSLLGFYGHTPAAQPSATGITTLAQLITVLQSNGTLGT